MSENKLQMSAFEAALDKASQTQSFTSPPPPPAARGSEPGLPPLPEEEFALPERSGREEHEAPRRRASDMPETELSGFPVSDADFERFEDRFGIGPGQKTTFDNAFRIVRTTVLQGIKARGGQVIGVTSPTARNGKTVSSIHLARACARREEQTVVLADLNLQRPLLAGYLDAREFRSGIGFFRGEGQPRDYLTRAEEGRLLLFLSDRATAQSAELLASPRLKEALDSFKTVGPNTVVIVNLPPLLGSDDVMTIMPQLDGVVMVAAAGESSFSEIDEAARMVPEEKMICAILNKSKDTHLASAAD